MNTQNSNPLAALDNIKGKNPGAQTRNAISLHKSLTDQDILVKFYAPVGTFATSLPKGLWHSGAQDQARVNELHAKAAKAFGRDDKAYIGRERPGQVDTANFKMEATGRLEPGHIFGEIERAGFRVLQARIYLQVRSLEEKRRLQARYGADKVTDQSVVELRFTHKDVWEEKLAVFESCKEGGLKPNADLLDEIYRFFARSSWGACTTWSNTITLDPTVTINFRNMPMGGKPQRITLRDGKLFWEEIR